MRERKRKKNTARNKWPARDKGPARVVCVKDPAPRAILFATGTLHWRCVPYLVTFQASQPTVKSLEELEGRGLMFNNPHSTVLLFGAAVDILLFFLCDFFMLKLFDDRRREAAERCDCKTATLLPYPNSEASIQF